MSKKISNPQEILNQRIESLEKRIKFLEVQIVTKSEPQVLKNEFYEEKINNLKVVAEKAILQLKQKIRKLQIENKKSKLKINHLKEELKRERTRK